MHPIITRSYAFSPARSLAIALIVYASSFGILLRNKSFEPAEAIIVLVVFGGVFPLLAWAATVRAVPLLTSMKPNTGVLVALIGYLVLLSLYLIGGPQWIDEHLPHFWIDSARIRLFAGLVKKLVVFVTIPFLMFRFGFGYRARDFGVQLEGLRVLRGSHLAVVLVVGAAFLCFQYFFSGGGAAFRREHFTAFQLFVGLPLCFIWLFIEAGLVEEFFFRGLVQSQFAAVLKSEVGGVLLMSLIFGLAHAPGFIFRHAGDVEGLGSHPGAIDAIAYSIVVLAVSGITFGVIWARTKNLFAVMLIHAAGDLLPNFPSFVRTWF
jgi:membrane protease YdiL (CAAX protease family)